MNLPKQVTTRCCIRILAYIWADYGARDKSSFPNGPVPHDHGLRAEFLGFFCDVTVEVESVINDQTFNKVIDHYGDGILRETLDEARYHVLTTTGILPEILPERLAVSPPKTGEWKIVVARTVLEFEPTPKRLEDVEAESFIKSIGKRAAFDPDTASPTAYTQ